MKNSDYDPTRDREDYDAWRDGETTYRGETYEQYRRRSNGDRRTRGAR